MIVNVIDLDAEWAVLTRAAHRNVCQLLGQSRWTPERDVRRMVLGALKAADELAWMFEADGPHGPHTAVTARAVLTTDASTRVAVDFTLERTGEMHRSGRAVTFITDAQAVAA